MENLKMTESGVCSVMADEPGITLEELSNAAMKRGAPLEEVAYFQPRTVTWSYGVHAASVEVDVETGEVSVLKYVVVHDCGTVINPMIVDVQVHGGVAQGIGEALLERVVFDEADQLLNPSFAAYVIPTAADLPLFEIDHIETPSPLK